ncbi:MAG TPA: nuclear transport factor 2 family protein [Acidimicrobiales bacterium]|nr:nuclear transport factor 2 family protein [Acidimicrobiales bacterium]
MRRTRLAAAACGLAVLLAAAVPSVASASPPPKAANPTATARPLVHRFFVLLAHQNRAGLTRFLAPGFQIERADGSGETKSTYLTDLPTITTFAISGLTATESNGALVARYTSTVTGTANGKPYTPGPAPRLSVFTWNGHRWQLAAHANFNPLTG